MKIFLSQKASTDALLLLRFLRRLNRERANEVVSASDLGEIFTQVSATTEPVLVVIDYNPAVQAFARLLRAGSQRDRRELVLVFAHVEDFPPRIRESALFDGFIDKAQQAGSFRPVAQLIAGVTDEDTIETLKQRHPFILTPPNW